MYGLERERERERERDLVYSIHLISKGVLSGINKVTISLMWFVMVLFISKKITYFPSSVTLVQRKCGKIYKMKTPNTSVVYYFHLLFSKGNTDMDVYRADVTFLIPIEEMDFCFL